MKVGEEFKKFMESLSEDRRKKLEDELNRMSEEEREFLKTYVVIARAYEEAEKERRELILSKVNREELEKVSKEELVLALYGVIWQACGDDKGNVDSGALSLYADAMRLLSRLGLLEIKSEYGRVVIGRLRGLRDESE